MSPCHFIHSGVVPNFTQLPWSTSNEDLVELFTTIGKVERAEIQYEPNGRSRGTGVVEFDSADNAETAIGTLQTFVQEMRLSNFPIANSL